MHPIMYCYDASPPGRDSFSHINTNQNHPAQASQPGQAGWPASYKQALRLGEGGGSIETQLPIKKNQKKNIFYDQFEFATIGRATSSHWGRAWLPGCLKYAEKHWCLPNSHLFAYQACNLVTNARKQSKLSLYTLRIIKKFQKMAVRQIYKVLQNVYLKGLLTNVILDP